MCPCILSPGLVEVIFLCYDSWNCATFELIWRNWQYSDSDCICPHVYDTGISVAWWCSHAFLVMHGIIARKHVNLGSFLLSSVCWTYLCMFVLFHFFYAKKNRIGANIVSLSHFFSESFINTWKTWFTSHLSCTCYLDCTVSFSLIPLTESLVCDHLIHDTRILV